MLIDGNSIINRAFYGLRTENLLANSKGIYTNAVFGFLNILNKYLEDEKPSHIAVAFDMRKPTFRHEAYKEYKANRKGMPDELAMQLPIVKEILRAMNIAVIEKEGYEADDIIGTLAKHSSAENIDVRIVTGDRDSLQLVDEKINILLPVTKMGKTITEKYDIDAVKEKYGIDPLQLIDVKGLMGDKSDNIPGVMGVGEKTALSLIAEYGSLESVYEHIDEISKVKLKEKLETDKELAFLSKELGTVEIEVPNMLGTDSFEVKEFDNDKLYNIFSELEFKLMIKKYGLEGNIEPSETVAIKTKIVYDSNEVIDYIMKDSTLKKIYFTCGFSKDREPSYIVFMKEGTEPIYFEVFSSLESVSLFGALKPVFENEGIAKCSYSIKPLMTYLKQLKIDIKGDIFDAGVGAYVINPSRKSYEIDRIIEEFCEKEVNTTFENNEEERASLNGTYLHLLPEVEKKISEKIKENNQENLLYNIEFPLITVLSDMEYYGFSIDKSILASLGDELDKNLDILTEEIYELAGEEFNINSPKQMGVVLFEKLELPVGGKTKTGYSTDASTLEKLKDKHEIIPYILEYRQNAKFKSTYVDGLKNAMNVATGKIHSVFNQTVTTTGRISSSEPNMQNIPVRSEFGREFRKVFVPSSSDYTILDADYSQIELRILADIAGDQDMIEAFREKKDIHTVTAAKVFNVDVSDVDDIMRSRAKAVNFGIVYGISSYGLARDLDISPKEAKTYIDEYFEEYAGVKSYIDNIIESAKKDGYVTTIFNRRRYIPEINSSNFNLRSFGERLAMNTPIQGSAADIIKIAMVSVHKKLEGYRSKLILQVHDELLVETHKDEVEDVKIIIKDCMENAIKLKVDLVAEVKEGNSWYEAK